MHTGQDELDWRSGALVFSLPLLLTFRPHLEYYLLETIQARELLNIIIHVNLDKQPTTP